MRIVARGAFGLAMLAPIALPAQPASDGPSFEVASVKVSAMADGAYGTGLFTLRGGRIVANMCKLDY
jgi:hypothetical protein